VEEERRLWLDIAEFLEKLPLLEVIMVMGPPY